MALKKANPTFYQTVLRQVAKGRIAFRNFRSTVPNWVKVIFAGFTADEIYDTAMWILGIG